MKIDNGHSRRPGDRTADPAARQVSADRLIMVTFADHDILCDPTDDKIGATLLSGRPYQRRHLDGAIAMLERAGRLRRGGVFLDVGANIGAMTLYAARSGRFERVVAIEPEPHNAAIMRRNIVLNDLGGTVTVIDAAASDRTGVRMLNLAARNLGAHSLERLARAERGGETRVPVATTDAMLHKSDIPSAAVSMIKIDVEGHELAVLDGMVALLALGVPVMLELNAAGDPVGRADALRARLGPCYRWLVDLEHASAARLPQPMALEQFVADDIQHDILVF